MSYPVQSATFDIQGEDALKRAIMLLEQFESDTPYTHVRVKLSGTQSDEDVSENQVANDSDNGTLSDFEDFKESKAGTEKQQGVKSGTSYHKALSALSELSDGEPIPTKEIRNHLNMKQGTVYAAMSELHKRGLVQRTKNEDNSYEYTISHFGLQELKRVEEQ